MELKTLNQIYYSPTGTSKKIISTIAHELAYNTNHEYDLTKHSLSSEIEIPKDCLTLMAMPVYAGRIPENVISNIQNFSSKGSPIVLIVVYGNRDFDDAMLELKEIVQDRGFKVIAAAAFIGEHSFATKEMPIAIGRPDINDIKKCASFAQLLTDKINTTKQLSHIEDIQVRGNYPYRVRKPHPIDIVPTTNLEQCNQCGFCVEVCPTNAITIQENIITNGELCTWCCACVKACPNEARIFDNSALNTIRETLYNNCSERKEPEIFI
jgi:ferredoxin